MLAVSGSSPFSLDISIYERGLSSYVNAGHNAPLVCDADGIRTLQDGSIALGMMQKLPFLNVGEAALPKPATILCYTDGLVEQEDIHGNAFETTMVERMMVELGGNGPQFLNKALMKSLRDTPRHATVSGRYRVAYVADTIDLSEPRQQAFFSLQHLRIKLGLCGPRILQIQ